MMNTQQEVNAIISSLRALNSQIAKTIKSDLKGPADFLASAIKGRTPVGARVHKRYKSGKSMLFKRMPKGSGVVVATYRPGNLRKSIKTLTKLRRVKYAQIVGANTGSGANDGYYLHFSNNDVKMSNGKVRPGKRFVESAILAAGPAAQRAVVQILQNKLSNANRAGQISNSSAWASGYR